MLRWMLLLLGVVLSFGSTASVAAAQPQAPDGEHATLPAPPGAAEEVSEEEAMLDEAASLQGTRARPLLAADRASARSLFAPPLKRPPRR